MRCTVCHLDSAKKQVVCFLNVNEQGEHSGTEVHELCNVCLDRLEKFRLPYEFPRRKARVYEPGSFLYLASVYGIGTAVETFFERLFHGGVSWYEASDLAEWLYPQLALTDKDFKKIWRDFCVLRRFGRNRKEYRIYFQKVINYLRNEYMQSDGFRLLLPKLRYIFQKYGSFYYDNPPKKFEKSEWQKVVNEIKKALDIFDKEYTEAYNVLYAYFWPYLEYFWF